MSLEEARTISHSIEIEFMCETRKEKVVQNIKSPNIGEGQYYEDWTYRYIIVNICDLCKGEHRLEID